MPVYEYRCQKGHKFDRYLSMADYREPQTCDCGAEAKKIFSRPMLNLDMQPWDRYISPATGEVITSYKERNEDMKKSGCVDYEPSLKANTTKHMNTEDAKLEKAMDETVEREIANMPSDKKEKLFNEVASSELEYTRL